MSADKTDPRNNRWPVPAGSRTSACRSCGMVGVWIKTTNEKNLLLSLRTQPLTTVDDEGNEKILEPSVVVVEGERWARPHFWDCAQGKTWSKKGRT